MKNNGSIVKNCGYTDKKIKKNLTSQMQMGKKTKLYANMCQWLVY